MSQPFQQALSKALSQIDRPGSFCVSGSAPTVLPGLEVTGVGPIAFPLTDAQAQELKKHSEQAPYGKGEETLVDTNVRRVWHLTPERFKLTNPEWESFLKQTLSKVKEELGLKGQKLESHLYDLLLYEPGSFFLPHRDGEKLDRMVATLVIVLPSSFEGGELVVRHEGEEQVIDFGGSDSQFRLHYAAFYADCEHEIRPLQSGHRLCLVYNLTLGRSRRPIKAPRHLEHVERIRAALQDWATAGDTPSRLAVTLEHQYTQEGLTWDALKGVDRAQARALLEGGQQAGCQVTLALLTLHESGSAECEGGYGYGRRSRWYDDEEDEEPGDYEMGEIYETTLTAEHWIDAHGKRLALGPLHVDDEEVLDPEALQAVEPEEEFEGYTGNAGMTLDRWYRHAAVFLWPVRSHFDLYRDAGSWREVDALGQLVARMKRASETKADGLRAEGIDFASTILAHWPENLYGGGVAENGKRCPMFQSLAALGEPRLMKQYLREVLPKDAGANPGKTLADVCREHGWETFRKELKSAFEHTTTAMLERNVRLLEHICLANAHGQEAWAELCESLAQTLVAALEEIDRPTVQYDWRAQSIKRADVLAGLARALLATEQFDLLKRVVDHALARPEKYPLATAHVAALTELQPWLAKHARKRCPALKHWLTACREQLEALTAPVHPPIDFRRDAKVTCKCKDCAELNRFLEDPKEHVHRFRAVEARRRHLEEQIRQHQCDVDCKTEKSGSPYTLVCTKNRASYQAKIQALKQNQDYLATVKAIQGSLPG